MAYTAKHEPIAAPMIGHLREQGLTAARVFCASIWCGHMILVAFDDLGLSDQTPFLEIKTRRRWSCERCGSRKVSVMPDWRDPHQPQAGRTGRDISRLHQPLANPGVGSQAVGVQAMNDNGENTLKDQQGSTLLPGGLLGDVVAAQGAAAHHEVTVAAPIRAIAGRLMTHADPEVRTMGEDILRHLEVGK